MADLTATFEAGVNGATITTAGGEASASAWVTVNGTPSYSNTHVAYGNLAAKIPVFDDWMQWDQSSSDFYGRLFLYATAFPDVETAIVNMTRTSAPTNDMQVAVRTDGALRIRDATGSNIFGSVPITLNQWVRVEFHMLHLVSPDGKMEARLFNDHTSSSPSETIGPSDEASAFATEHIFFGKSRFGTWNTDVWMDNIVSNATTWPGPVVAPVAASQRLQPRRGGTGRW